MDEITGRIVSSVIEHKSRRGKIRITVITDTGKKCEFGFADAVSNILPDVGSTVRVKQRGGIIYEILDIDGVSPQVYVKPNQVIRTSEATAGQTGIVVLVISVGILLILAGFTNLQYIGVYLFLGVVQIAAGYILYSTLKTWAGMLVFMVNLFTLIIWLVALGTSTTISSSPVGAIIQLILILLQTSLVCILVCPRSMDKFYG